MANWRKILHHSAVKAERLFDDLKWRLTKRLGTFKPVDIHPYRGYGRPERVRLRGRVMKHPGELQATDRDAFWNNLLNTYRRFASTEIPGVRVQARLGETSREVTTDNEGYFHLSVEPDEPLLDDRFWYEIDLKIDDTIGNEEVSTHATTQAVVPPTDSTLGIISDIDDTILQTDATSLIKMARVTFLGNARTRLPFDGVAAFYRALQDGPEGVSKNPIFYVSSSPWNLYDLLVDFMELQDIPKGPLFLTDLGLDETKIIKPSHHEHKIGSIERILEMYPDLPFVLIGDSGQKDPEIYREVAQRYPGQIEAVYIRNVTSEERGEEVRTISQSVAEEGPDFLLARDSAAAAEHAAERGFIHPDTLSDIRTEKDEDARTPGDLELLLEEDLGK